MKKIRSAPFGLILAILGLLLLVGCGGSGGGGGSGPSLTTNTDTDTGTVALYLKDGPVDADEINITITKVALIPMSDDDDADDDDGDVDAFDDDGEDGDDDNAGDEPAPVVIFESAEGESVNLLAYAEEPYLFLVDDTIPAGEYAKIRLWISDIEVIGGPCKEEDVEVKLPSGKIDLNPPGGFEVVPGEALAIELDVDLEKSIQLIQAGNSGKCIFRPVVFVDIYDDPAFMPRCPRIISGKILELIYEEVDETKVVVGFEMELANAGHHKRPVTVMLENATIFDGSGNLIDAEELAEEDTVNVRAKLNSEGALDASLVVVGDVAMVSGVALGGVDADNIFQLDPDEGQIIVHPPDAPLNVQVLDGAFVLIGCGGEVDASAIQEGMETLVVGKITTSGQFLAVVVVLRPLEISGALVAIEPEADGNELTIKVDPDDAESPEIHVFLPHDVWPHIKGDGLLPLWLLTELVECDTQPLVEIKLNSDQQNVAAELAVVPFDLSGTVVAVNDPDDDLLTLDIVGSDEDLTIEVFVFPTILDENSSLVGFGEIAVGDTIVTHGLASCDEGIAQIAFVLSIQPPLPNIVEIAKGDDRFETLVTALEAAGLDDDLAGDGPFTVFAPTDEAFANLPEGVLQALLDDPDDALANVLTYHVYAGELLEADVIELDGETVDMLNGLGVTIDVDEDEDKLILNQGKDGKAKVIVTDILASNGIIHVIDAVLDPEDAP